MNFDWKKIVGAIAPALGTALVGPAGGVAAAAIANALGLPDAQEETISAAVEKMTPADILLIKKAEQDFIIRNRELDNDAEKVRLADTADARKREVSLQDKAVPRLAALVVSGFIGMSVIVLTGAVKVDSVLAGTVIGYVSGACTQVLSYYFGTSKSSNDKNVLLQAKR